jgi:hypothetical protein
LCYFHHAILNDNENKYHLKKAGSTCYQQFSLQFICRKIKLFKNEIAAMHPIKPFVKISQPGGTTEPTQKHGVADQQDGPEQCRAIAERMYKLTSEGCAEFWLLKGEMNKLKGSCDEANLGCALLEFPPSNMDAFISDMQQAADRGYAPAQYLFGLFLFNNGDVYNGLEQIRSAAAQGCGGALYFLAQIAFEKGDVQETLYYLILAAEAGVSAAHYQLGVMEPDSAKKLQHFQLAKKDGYRAALYELALMEPNLEKKLSYLQLAADKGFIPAYHEIGRIRIEEKDWKSARPYLAIAVYKSHIPTMLMLSEQVFQSGAPFSSREMLFDWIHDQEPLPIYVTRFLSVLIALKEGDLKRALDDCQVIINDKSSPIKFRYEVAKLLLKIPGGELQGKQLLAEVGAWKQIRSLHAEIGHMFNNRLMTVMRGIDQGEGTVLPLVPRDVDDLIGRYKNLAPVDDYSVEEIQPPQTHWNSLSVLLCGVNTHNNYWRIKLMKNLIC